MELLHSRSPGHLTQDCAVLAMLPAHELTSAPFPARAGCGELVLGLAVTKGHQFPPHVLVQHPPQPWGGRGPRAASLQLGQ